MQPIDPQQGGGDLLGELQQFAGISPEVADAAGLRRLQQTQHGAAVQLFEMPLHRSDTGSLIGPLSDQGVIEIKHHNPVGEVSDAIRC